jgi:hypothetical protein
VNWLLAFAGLPRLTATASGPLYPTPNPAEMRSYAWRSVVDFGVAPTSSWPRFRDKNGMASGMRIVSTAPIASQGWPVTARAHAPQNPRSGGFGLGRMNAGTRTDSTWCPSSEKTAGRRVSAARTAVTTASADA